MSSPALFGTDASRPRSRSGILTPSSDGSNRHLSPAERKRKRASSVAMDHLLQPSIALKPHPPNLHTQPRILQPLMVLPRQHLPLSYIDFVSTGNELSQSRLFESHVKVLDLESRMGSVPVVLLARSESSGTVYALERQEDGLYVACRLGSWIDLGGLARYANAISRERLRPTARPRLQGQETADALATPQLHKAQKTKRAAIEAIQSLVKKKARSQSVTVFDEAKQEPSELAVPSVSQMPTPKLKQEDDAESGQHEYQAPFATVETSSFLEESSQQTTENMLENIRTQYFNALYKSMGSLAYFAKGPLSRARSTFHLDLEANLDMSNLIGFLKSLVLTTVQIDKKYRETIPDVVAKMKTTVESSDEGQRRKRRSKRTKLGKNGLYPFEEEYVRNWWSANKPELNEDDINVPTQQVKSLASMLRTRETQLQMILILEILALEPLKAAEDAEENSLPVLPGSAESHVSMAPPLTKKRNKHNLPVLIDVHADRLTIWQSTVSDEQLLLEDSQSSRQPGEGVSAQKASSEPLKDFCVDVIVPFFSARLPDLCDSINRKLGGPVIVAPSKSRTLKRSSNKRDLKPGSATKRPAAAQAPRTLQRALSTEQLHRRSVSRGPSNMIALMRSATSTSLPGVKREGSEPAAANNVLRTEPNLLNRQSGSLSRSISMTSLGDSKATKKARVDAELKDAITALRKPNREVVGKAMAEAAQHRASTSLTLSAKKVRKPARNSLGTPVQVKATPANSRYKDMFAPRPDSAADLPGTEEIIPPSSATSMIPSTGLRPGYRDFYPMNAIDATPTKQPSFIRRPANEEPAIPPSSPLMDRGNELFVPGSAVKEQRRIDFTTSRNEGVFATPIKRRVAPEAHVIADSPSVPVGKVSIYQQLGWDDELDDLL